MKKIKSKKFILGFIAGVILTLIFSGILGGRDETRYQYTPGPEGGLYKIDTVSGDVFWIRGDEITKVRKKPSAGQDGPPPNLNPLPEVKRR